MNSVVLLLASATLGVDVGWQPLSEGGVEYIIQIEPEQLGSLSRDQDLASDLPPALDVRRFRVTVGRGKLPRDAGDPFATNARSRSTADSGEIDPQEGPLLTGANSSTSAAQPLRQVSNLDNVQKLQPAPTASSPSDLQEANKPVLPSVDAEANKPWMPLLFTAVALCVSLGGNVYLGWIAYSARSRYRGLVDKFRSAKPVG